MSKRDSIEHLQEILMDGGARVFDVAPLAIINVIEDEAWKDRLDANGTPFVSFEALVCAPYWHGLESSVDEVLTVCRKNAKAQEAIKRAIGAASAEHVGRGHSSDNVRTNYGNNPTYTLRRLKRDRPDLAERVVSGEMSANAAAIEAGFRKPPKKLARCPHCGGTL